MQRIAIIGSGRRVQETVLPAIEACGTSAKLVDIYSRTRKDVRLSDGRTATTRTDLEDFDFDGIDVLIVAVTTKAVREVLELLKKKGGRQVTVLIVDTPPLRFSELWRKRLFSGYRSVGVGEDWARLSPVVAARRVISEGRIGELRSILMFHSGYRYHALAVLKVLSGVRSIKSIRFRRFSRNCGDWDVRLGRNIIGRVIEPRDYANGRLLIVGSTGVISDYSFGHCENNSYYIEYPAAIGWYQPVKIGGHILARDEIDDNMRTFHNRPLANSTRINLLKIGAYARILADTSLGKEAVAYPLGDGIYDYFAATIAEEYGRFLDVSFSSGRNSLFRRLLTIRNDDV